MFKKLLTITFSWICMSSSVVDAALFINSPKIHATEYEIVDIGTLQTHSSEAIDLNNHGQILGWYNIDGSEAGKHFFVRDRDGTFYELPHSHQNMPIQWIWLKDNERAYGVFIDLTNLRAGRVLFSWSKQDGVLNLGMLPEGHVCTINNKGQALIQLGAPNNYSIIWNDGQIIRLRGLVGDLGVESSKSYGYDMNDNGDVVGKCLVSLVYKNKVYERFHAVIWENGVPRDLHSILRKSENSEALLINNRGDFHAVADRGDQICINGKVSAQPVTILNDVFFFHLSKMYALDSRNVAFCSGAANLNFSRDRDSIWMRAFHPFHINNNGEVVCRGTTIFGENHIILFTPKNGG